MASATGDYDPTYVEDLLECAVCLEIVRSPHTLQECLHGFCKQCVDQLEIIQKDNQPGVECPVCRNFCAKDKIMSDFFRKELAEMHMSLKKTGVVFCEQCLDIGEKVKATLKCIDCKSALCQRCKTIHLGIKLLQGHTVVALEEAQKAVLDHLEFCKVHTDKPIELFCEVCKSSICLKCKVTEHDSHKTTTVEKALDKMKPEIETKLLNIENYTTMLKESINQLDSEVENLQNDYSKCSKTVDETAEKRIQEIKRAQKKMKEGLKNKLELQVNKIQDEKEKLMKKLNEGENVKKVVENSVERARHASLLLMLCEGGLMSKIRDFSVNTSIESRVTISRPSIFIDEEKWKSMLDSGLVGKVNHVDNNLEFQSGNYVIQFESRRWNVSFEKYFKRNLQREVDVPRSDHTTKLCLINDHLWAAQNHCDFNGLNIYGKNGKSTKIIPIQSPMSVKQASNGNVIVCCHDNNGVHVVNPDYSTSKIVEGSFSDLYAYGDKMYALECKEETIYIFSCCDDNMEEHQGWRNSGKILLREHKRGDVGGRFDTLLITGSPNEPCLHIYIMLRGRNSLYLYNDKGECIKQHREDLSCPWLCGIDNKSNLIINDQGHTRYKLFNTKTQQWGASIQTQLQKDESCVHDIIPDTDGSVWQVGTRIRKYVPQ